MWPGQNFLHASAQMKPWVMYNVSRSNQKKVKNPAVVLHYRAVLAVVSLSKMFSHSRREAKEVIYITYSRHLVCCAQKFRACCPIIPQKVASIILKCSNVLIILKIIC